MEKFAFKAIDKEGVKVLETVAVADKFNAWMFAAIQPYCKGKVLEIGSGIGNMSQFFVEHYDTTLSDIRETYCSMLTQKFSSVPTCRDVRVIDLGKPDFETSYPDMIGQFDTVVALNVVEHIYDDKMALMNCVKLLRSGGNTIILVPAYQWMYNRFDKEVEHYRRYTKKALQKLFIPEFTLVHSQYFNVAGMLGWFVSARILRNKTIPQGQMSLYNKLMPLIKMIDKLFFHKIGLSVIQVGKVNN